MVLCSLISFICVWRFFDVVFSCFFFVILCSYVLVFLGVAHICCRCSCFCSFDLFRCFIFFKGRYKGGVKGSANGVQRV